MGTIYLLHYERPIGIGKVGKAQHYRGWTRNLKWRLKHHAAGNGASLTAAFAREGITFVVARTWEGDRNRERQLKNQGSAARQCPVCRPSLRKLVLQ